LTSKLYITNIAQRHAGTYRCYAVVGGNPDQRNVTLQIFREISNAFYQNVSVEGIVEKLL